MADGIGARHGGKSRGVGGGSLEGGGVLAVELDFHAGKRRTGVAREGIDQGFRGGEFPGKADVCELDEGLGIPATFLAAVLVRHAGDVEEEGGVAEVFGQEFVPNQGDFLGSIDGISERDFFVEKGFTGDQRIGQRRGGLDGFAIVAAAGVVAVALIGADEIAA